MVFLFKESSSFTLIINSFGLKILLLFKVNVECVNLKKKTYPTCLIHLISVKGM